MIKKEYPNGTEYTLKKESDYYILGEINQFGRGESLILKYEDLVALKDFIQNIDFNTL